MEGGAFLNEFKQAGFRKARILKTTKNARAKNPNVLAADVFAER
jgi:hypothetical protein